MSLEAGRVLSTRYRLVRPLGQGSQGAVWIADHLALNTHVAVKLIDPELAKREDARERFKREATAAAQLRSAHVVQILDHGIDEGQPFIVMELLEGEDLFERFNKRGRLTLRETSRVITQVCRALARAHAAGIVHRDLKPENVFLCANEDDEVVKVLDFGVAKVKDPAKRTMQRTGVGTLIGTPHYMSPEQVKGVTEVDFRTDLWALGVIAYQCVVGELPFDSEGVGDLLIKISIGDPPVPSRVYPGLPAAFDTWFARACDRDPSKRFQSARELAEALAKVVAIAERGAETPRPASMRPPASGPPRPSAKAGPPPVPKKSATPAPPAARVDRSRTEMLDASDLEEVNEAGARVMVPSSGDIDIDDFEFDFDEQWGQTKSGIPPLAARSSQTAAPPARSSQPGPAAPTPPQSAGTRTRPPLATPLPATATPQPVAQPQPRNTPQPFAQPQQRTTPAPFPALAPPAPEAAPTFLGAPSALAVDIPPPPAVPSMTHAPARTVPTATAPGIAGGVLSIPPPPELDGSRRRRTLAFIGVAFMLVIGGLAVMVVRSNMLPTNASPVPSATPGPVTPEPPPVVEVPNPTASFGSPLPTTKTPTGKGVRPTSAGTKTTTKGKTATTKKKADDGTIEIPDPPADEGSQEPPPHVEPPSPGSGDEGTIPPAP